jgi:hypothetical protein
LRDYIAGKVKVNVNIFPRRDFLNRLGRHGCPVTASSFSL